MLRTGSLFTGYGGLDTAAHAVLGGETAWVSDIKPASVALLEQRYPSVPNIGDLTRYFPADPETPADLRDIAPIDILTAGWPCQPHSAAGKRLGEADPRALWPNVARAIAELRPRVFLGENVARVAGNGELRRVVRSLAALGYVGTWRCVTASEVGAPHKRDRCFVVAVRADVATDPEGVGWLQGGAEHAGQFGGSDAAEHGPALAGAVPGGSPLTLLPTPTQNMTTGPGRQGRAGGMNLQTAAMTLIPTPRESDAGPRGGATGHGLRSWSRDLMRGDQVPPVSWGVYAAAVERWERALGRPAPAPTQLGPRGGFQLAPPFVEWMMGVPEGWVSQCPGLAPRANGERNARLSLLGDGVVPQQAAYAYRAMLGELLALPIAA